jgi:hypothetical protein
MARTQLKDLLGIVVLGFVIVFFLALGHFLAAIKNQKRSGGKRC